MNSFDTVISRSLETIEMLRRGETVTPRDIATRYGISVRSAQRLCNRVQQWVDVEIETGKANGKRASTKFTAKS